MVIQLPKYVTHIKGELKYKYGQQEQVTLRNHKKFVSDFPRVLTLINPPKMTIHSLLFQFFIEIVGMW